MTDSVSRTGPPGSYQERLGVPRWLAGVALGLWASLALALGAALSPWVGLPLLILGGGAVAAGLPEAEVESQRQVAGLRHLGGHLGPHILVRVAGGGERRL